MRHRVADEDTAAVRPEFADAGDDPARDGNSSAARNIAEHTAAGQGLGPAPSGARR
ncbi:hypothetical protein [Streptomyces sp. AJS327]|uniref:hypothetical protein n=1 Tax=Streptomyces sp. AJS327 TaxID=2545265 RepID=UPI0015DFA286|nr:hypothetical protein [Streptomyces sp. AJS327]